MSELEKVEAVIAALKSMGYSDCSVVTYDTRASHPLMGMAIEAEVKLWPVTALVKGGTVYLGVHK